MLCNIKGTLCALDRGVQVRNDATLYFGGRNLYGVDSFKHHIQEEHHVCSKSHRDYRLILKEFR